MTDFSLTPAQLRAARGIIKLSARDFAAAAKIAHTTVHRMEGGDPAIQAGTLRLARVEYERRGVEFLEGGWVRLAKDSVADG